MEKEKIVHIVESKFFKQVTFFLGIIFILLSLFISFNPEPFLRFSYLGIFIFNMLGGSGVLLVPSLVRFFNLTGLAFATAAGMGFNDSVAWLVGNSGQTIIGPTSLKLPKSSWVSPESLTSPFTNQSNSGVKKGKKVKLIEKSINKYGVFALFFWSLIPFPYDLIGFVAGYLGLSYVKYIIPTFLGKFVRIILLGLGIISLIS